MQKKVTDPQTEALANIIGKVNTNIELRPDQVTALVALQQEERRKRTLVNLTIHRTKRVLEDKIAELKREQAKVLEEKDSAAAAVTSIIKAAVESSDFWKAVPFQPYVNVVRRLVEFIPTKNADLRERFEDFASAKEFSVDEDAKRITMTLSLAVCLPPDNDHRTGTYYRNDVQQVTLTHVMAFPPEALGMLHRRDDLARKHAELGDQINQRSAALSGLWHKEQELLLRFEEEEFRATYGVEGERNVEELSGYLTSLLGL